MKNIFNNNYKEYWRKKSRIFIVFCSSILLFLSPSCYKTSNSNSTYLEIMSINLKSNEVNNKNSLDITFKTNLPKNTRMWIGNFTDSATIGVDIVLADSSYFPEVELARKHENIIDVNGLTGFELKKKREQILPFIDAAAFYGLHFKKGVKVDGTNSKLKEENLYTDIIDYFHTKNTLYLDIRNEESYSYNFFGNYDDGSGNNLKLSLVSSTPILTTYENYQWPILAIDAASVGASNLTDVNIELHIADNPEPLIFYTDVVNTPKKPNTFIGKDAIASVGSTFGKQLLFQLFNNASQGVANYIRINYTRQVPYVGSNPRIPVKTDFHTNLFGSIHHKELDKIYDGYNYLDLGTTKLVAGTLNSGYEFSHINKQYAIWDDNHLLFIGQKIVDKLKSKIELPKKAFGYLNVIKNEISSNIRFESDFVIDDSLANHEQLVRLFRVRSNSRQDNNIENFKFLGLGKAELSQLKQYSGLSDFSKNIHLEPILPTTGNTFFKDEYNTPYYKYTVKVNGYNNMGNLSKGDKGSLDAIEVYSLDNIAFHSKSFIENELIKEYLEEESITTFVPRDASVEMEGKEFEFRMDWESKGIQFRVGDVVIAKKWNNNTLYQTFYDKNRNVSIEPYKWRLKPKLNLITCQVSSNKSVKIAHYYPKNYGTSLEGQSNVMFKRYKEMEKIKNNPSITNYREDINYKDFLEKQKRSNKALNDLLIQQTVWNCMDNSFCKWSKYYNDKIGKSKGWQDFNPNLAKSLALKETKLGTYGEYLKNSGVLMTTHTVMQTIDSGGLALIYILREFDKNISLPNQRIIHKYDYEDVLRFEKIARRIETKVASGQTLTDSKYLAKYLENDEKNDDDKLNVQYGLSEKDVFYCITQIRSKGETNWNRFIIRCTNWRDENWDKSWVENNKKWVWLNAVKELYQRYNPKNPHHTYDFWIRVGIRWIFFSKEEYNKNDWSTTIKTYNSKSSTYSTDIVNRFNNANGKNYIYIEVENL